MAEITSNNWRSKAALIQVPRYIDGKINQQKV